MTIDDLGRRICILGPSNSGKSTLALAIADRLGLPPVHLDRLRHLPNTDWVARPDADFAALHDAAIATDEWVMEGNYSALLPQRLARATGVILLDVSTTVSLVRYIRRRWFGRDRAGALEGGKDSVKLVMIRHIVVTTPGNRKAHARLFGTLAMPAIRLASPGAIAAFTAAVATAPVVAVETRSPAP